jgi:hypothetical protein
MSEEGKLSKKPSGEEIYSYRLDNLYLPWKEIAAYYKEPAETLRKREYRYRRDNDLPTPVDNLDFLKSEDKLPTSGREHKVKFTDKGFKAEAYSRSSRIKTLDQLLASSGTDLTKWRVTRHVINVWEGGRKKKIVDLTWTNGVMDGFVEDTGDWQLTDYWQVKAWFEPREEEPYEKALEALIDRVKKHAPRYKRKSFSYKPVNDGYLAVVNLYDAHLGKRVHRSIHETLEGARDNFIKISEVAADHIATSQRKVNKILFPVGHDLLHIDSLLDRTSRGTWVETSVDLRDAIDAACEATFKSIESFVTVAPVEVIPVEGNHDRLQVYWLAKFLKAFFKNHAHVTVRDANLERQYFQWGRIGLGLTHDGNKPQELATLFPIEARHMWPDIEWTEWLTGHMHHKRGALYAVDNIRATVVRTIPAMCNMDNYHSLRLYGGVHRAAEVLYYHNENGPAGSFPIFVSEL